MLYLLTSPAWAPPGQEPRPLPLTVPAALLVVLATRAAWVPREQLALIFWPDAAQPDALHHLRINLHRARVLLQSWGLGDALQAERSRVQLALPSDVAQLQAAQATGDVLLLQRLSPAQWLSGWRLPGYDGFAQWCDDTAQQLQTRWLAATRRALPDAPRPLTPPGREASFARLVASPSPALLLLGEPGAGKTTLLRAAHPNAPCLRGLEGLHTMPYRPLLDVLRAQQPLLLRALREPSHPLRPYRLDLARMLPELAPDEPLPPLDALTAQTRMVEALARAFEALTPILLVDDLQWCDGATVEWLLMLAHSGRLRWRATARQHEVSPALAKALQSLRGAARLETLEVAPLDRATLAAACGSRWPDQAFSAARLDRLHALSGGNPFLLGELVEAGLARTDGETADATPGPLLERVGGFVRARLQALPGDARQAVEAAAIFVQPVPADALRHLAGVVETPGWEAAVEHALAAGLLCRDAAGYTCRHDLIRQAVGASLPAHRLADLHRRAALWLAARPDADAMTIAEHWRSAGEAQTALAWRHRGAEGLKARGRFDEARAIWHEVADASTDAALALGARLELAACDLFEDLQRGRAALEAVQAQLDAVADPEQHLQIEGRLLSALVDNRVFAGDIAAAQVHARRLQTLLPDLPPRDRIDALEVMIELAMREPDIPGAWARLAQLREAAPRRPTLLSFEGQIHWFGGQVQAAHDALARLLERHPDYCRGITVENDLAVMLQALGEIDAAEVMARRSLQSWAGVAHTETLSLLVLGLVLISAGRHEEAEDALQRALRLAREQSSAGFEAEALVRRARLWLQCGRFDAARADLEPAATLLADSPEPLRVSQLALTQLLVALGSGQPAPARTVLRLEDAAARSSHPLVQARLARARVALAMQQCDWPAAAAAAAAQAEIAQRAGLREVLAEAWLLQAQCAHSARGTGTLPATAAAWAKQVTELAERQGFADLHRRARALGVELQLTRADPGAEGA